MKYTPADKIRQIWTREQAEELVEELWNRTDPIGLDTETEGCDVKKQSPVGNGKIVCWSLAYFDKENLGKHKLRGIPLAQPVFIPNWGQYDFLGIFKPWLESKDHPKVGHNIYTFDKHIFANHGIDLQGIYCDTLRLAKLLFNNKAIRIDLKRMMAKHLLYAYGDFKELFSAPGILKSKIKDRPTKSTRKILGQRVPTYVAAGEHCRFSVSKQSRRIIPLSKIDTPAYRCRMNTLIEYASLDAKASLELFLILKKKAEKTI